METRVCTKCNTEKHIEEYYLIKPNKAYKNGYRYRYCKKCHYHKMTKATAKKWRKENPERWRKDVKIAQRAMWDRDIEGVYLIITDKGLYVGQTDKYNSRIKQHMYSKTRGNMKGKGAKILYHTLLVEESDPDKRRKLEKKWIKKLRPALNKEFNPDYYKNGSSGAYEKR